MLVEEELTRIIKGCFFDVQNEIGLGLSEEAYQRGMIEALQDRGLAFASKPMITIRQHDRAVVELFPDFIVADRVILDLKTLREDFAREHYVQLFSYLKARRLRIGFLVNFGRERIYDRRLIYDEKPLVINEEWDKVSGKVGDHDRQTLASVRKALLEVAALHGLGYGEAIYRKLVTAALEAASLAVTANPLVTPRYKGKELGNHSVDCLLVDSRIMCLPMALKDGLSEFDKARAHSFAKNLNVFCGVVVNFGKSSLELCGIAGT